jgi:uncharacterized ferritin-like protein (DUF455 family)
MGQFPNASVKDISFSFPIRATAIGSSTAVTVLPIARSVLQTCTGTATKEHVIMHIERDAVQLSHHKMYQHNCLHLQQPLVQLL